MEDGSPGGVAYDDDAALKCGLTYDEEWDVPAELRVIDVDSEGVGVGENSADHEGEMPGDDATLIDEELLLLRDVEREARAVVDVIRQARGTPFYDAKLGACRPMEYGDMVVLLREARTSAPIFTEILLGEGINAYAESGDGYLGTIEIETFMNLLRAIDNIRQDVPLVSALYSPVFGFTTDELVEIRMSADRKLPFYHAFLACAGCGEQVAGNDVSAVRETIDVRDELAKKCVSALERIVGWRHEESFMELADFLWLVLKDSGWYDYAGALMGGDLRRANLIAMTTRASAYGSGYAHGLFGFIRYIESVEDKKLPMPQAKLVTEGEDVVRVMTVHKSKGLEYPLVIVAGLGKKLSVTGRSVRLTLHREFGIALTREEPGSHTWRRTLLTYAIAGRTEEEERSELLRLLYVAMTRAQDRLVLIGSMKGAAKIIACGDAPEVGVFGAKTFLDMLMPLARASGMNLSIVTASELASAIAAGERERIRSVEKLSELDVEDHFESADEMFSELDRSLSFRYPHEAAARLKSKYSVSELNRNMARGARAYFYVEESEAAAFEDEGKVDGADEISEDRENSDARTSRRFASEMNATMRGLALHKALERLDYAAARDICSGLRATGGAWEVGMPGAVDDSDLAPDTYNITLWFETYLDDLANGGFITPDQRAVVCTSDLMRFAASDICARVAASPRVRRETPFNYRMDMDGEQVVVQGVIDLFFEEGNELVLVDFKSGGARPHAGERARHALENYGEQMRLYRDALEAITGKNVRDTLLYLTSYGQVVPVPRPPVTKT
jgi:ATP-dependent helicase/nuclease subunit A